VPFGVGEHADLDRVVHAIRPVDSRPAQPLGVCERRFDVSDLDVEGEITRDAGWGDADGASDADSSRPSASSAARSASRSSRLSSPAAAALRRPIPSAPGLQQRRRWPQPSRWSERRSVLSLPAGQPSGRQSTQSPRPPERTERSPVHAATFRLFAR
jgi:hypothetical protein